MCNSSTLPEDFEDMLRETLEECLDNAVCDINDEIAAAVETAVAEVIEEQLSEIISNAESDTKNPRLRLLNPDKTKQVVCYGSLRVDGCTLCVQTRISCWEAIAVYPTSELAKTALLRVKAAMDAHLEYLEL